MLGRGTLGCAIALAVVVLIATGGVYSGPAPFHSKGALPARQEDAAVGSISVTAVKNYGYQPDFFQQVPTNATITVTFHDDDVLQHSFNISSREGYVIPDNDSAAQLNALFAKYPALYAATVNGYGDTSVGSFTSPSSPGWYEFVCNVTGHFQLGMFGFIAFGEDLPSNLTPPSHSGLGGPTLGSGIIALGGVVVILAAVVGLFLWRRRRLSYRLPPEQLH